MNRTLCFALFFTGLETLQALEPSDSHKLVDCGADKAVVIKDTESQDGRYAIGWTIRRRSKDAKPVNWSAWDGDLITFINRYETQDPERPHAPYELDNCLIDLKEKKMLILPSDWPYWPHKNRGYLDVVWSPVFKGSRYALVQNDSRFYTHNLWLAVIDSEGMHQRDIAPRLERPVVQFIRKMKPSSFADYGVFYPLHRSEFDTLKDASFNDSSAEIPFLADIPKSDDPNSSVTGIVTVRLPGGTVSQTRGTP